jgi:prepilin-type N-terminal cleavage/methylation domain-containing protein/prepilin-type processing-associated H-X9-DG protein
MRVSAKTGGFVKPQLSDPILTQLGELQVKLFSKKRKGFTLVELLVVISVIGLLAGMLLPAVQQAREAGRRSACQNNLRQLGLATHNFLDAFGYFPRSVCEKGDTARPKHRPATLTTLLPFLEQDRVYGEYKQDLTWGDNTTNGNGDAVRHQIPTYNCPSSIDPTRLDGDPNATAGWAYGAAAVTDYSPTSGVYPTLDGFVDTVTGSTIVAGEGIIQHACFDESLPPGPGNVGSSALGYVVRYRGPTTPGDVKDGLSNTILFAESAGRPYLYQNGARITTDTGILTVKPAATDSIVNGGAWAKPCSDLLVIGAADDGTITPTPVAGSILYPVNRTNGGAYDFTKWPGDTNFGDMGSGEVYAFHPTGANVVFGDGSVRLISRNIPLSIFAALVTRSSHDDTAYDASRYE